MKVLVTGAAGFIGSHLAERLLSLGHEVVGIDSLTDYYPRWIKRRNLEPLLQNPRFQYVPGDLTEINLSLVLQDTQWVFHHAAQAGVRASWGSSFQTYAKDNVLATQRLLEATKGTSIQKFVYASSSSIYGDAEAFPTAETAVPRPVSPYGVTKLAGEQLCYLYWRNYGVPTVALRYFTAYGPRQRPDMAFHLFGRALLEEQPIHIFGDGLQTRDFTYIDDVLTANMLAAQRGPPGEVFNIGGGSRISLREALAHLEAATGRPARLQYETMQKGDARHTAADIQKAQRVLGYQPTVAIAEGLHREVAWLKELLAAEAALPVDEKAR